MTLRVTMVSASLSILAMAGSVLAQKRPMTAVDLLEVPRLSEPRLSPDGRHVAYVLAEADWKANKRVSHLWWTDISGRERRQLTAGEKNRARG